MLELLKKLNPDLTIYSIRDREFDTYGKVLEFDSQEIISECEKLVFPESGSAYEVSVKNLETLGCSEKLCEMAIGGCDAQIGICHGYNSMMNGFEYHHSSEINVAVTPMILILGHTYEMNGNEFSSEKAKAFYLDKGDVVEIYGTTLHFCPCQVSDSGFSCVVVLPKNTNTLLDKPSEDKLLFKRNKWLICHDENKSLIEKGVYPGIHGINHEIKYRT